MSAHQRKLILEAYGIIGEATPLKGDCGKLCGGICCVGDDGMMLLPGEADLLSDTPGFYLFRVQYFGRRAWWMTCDDVCDRSRRPFQCRIYPLGPSADRQELITAVPDPRAKPHCPLADGERLEPEFWSRVNAAFAHLSQEPEIHRFLLAMAEDMRST